jgi:ubiquinone biosynthesis monooxygenase Coq6
MSAIGKPRVVHDIVICGGGVVGSLLGCLLAQSPALSRLSVGLVEPTPSPGPAALLASGQVDGRTYAISPSSARLLSSAGVWDAIAGTGRAPAYYGMHVWDALGEGRISFGRAGRGGGGPGEELGYMVEHEVLAGALWERLKSHEASGKVALYAGGAPPLRVASLSFPPSAVEAAWPGWARGPAAAAAGLEAPAHLTLTDATALEARLVVGADGAASPTRAAAGLGVAGLDYGQTAVCATVEVSSEEGLGMRGTAWQRFLPLGPIAILPLWGNYASIVWSTSPAHASALRAMPEGDFLGAVNCVLQAEPGEFKAAMAGHGGGGGANSSSAAHATAAAAAAAARGVGCAPSPPPRPPRVTALRAPLQAFPLRLQLALQYTRPRLALLGDAAHVVHPLAGQGLNAGIADAGSLAGTLEGRVGGLGEECGSVGVLGEYGGEAAGRNAALALGIHGLQRVFVGRGALPWGLEGVLPTWVAEGVWGVGGVMPWARALGMAVAGTPACARLLEGIAKGGGGGR